jgi:hypothetical protein
MHIEHINYFGTLENHARNLSSLESNAFSLGIARSHTDVTTEVSLVHRYCVRVAAVRR